MCVRECSKEEECRGASGCFRRLHLIHPLVPKGTSEANKGSSDQNPSRVSTHFRNITSTIPTHTSTFALSSSHSAHSSHTTLNSTSIMSSTHSAHSFHNPHNSTSAMSSTHSAHDNHDYTAMISTFMDKVNLYGPLPETMSAWLYGDNFQEWYDNGEAHIAEHVWEIGGAPQTVRTFGSVGGDADQGALNVLLNGGKGVWHAEPQHRRARWSKCISERGAHDTVEVVGDDGWHGRYSDWMHTICQYMRSLDCCVVGS